MGDREGVSNSLSRVDDIPDGGFAAAEAVIDGEYESILLFRKGDEVRAWLNVCPHAGRRLDYLPGKFLMDKGLLVCAAHGATFRTTDGECVAGPCRGAHLRTVPIAIEGDHVVLSPLPAGEG